MLLLKELLLLRAELFALRSLMENSIWIAGGMVIFFF